MKRQQEPENSRKAYIIVIDFARHGNLKLYGACIVERSVLGNLHSFEIEYFGNIPSKQRRKKIPCVRQRLRGVDKHLDLYVSRDVKRTLDIVEKYVRQGNAFVVVDPKVWRPFRSRFLEMIENSSIIAEVENKSLLARKGKRLLLKLLNITDAVIRWARNLFVVGKARLYVRLKYGTLKKR